jgi:hypothetical protein
MEFLKKFGCIFMKKILSETIRLIRDEKTEYFNEASITSLVCGILYSYGWNVFDPNEVAPQYNIRSEKHPQRVDLALKLFGKRKILIEIKDIKKGKYLKKYEYQLKGYLNKIPDVKVGILTNSASWWFYYSNEDENNHITINRQDKVDILKDSESFIEKIFSQYLSKEKMAEEWYQTNLNNLNNNSQKLTSIRQLRDMEDERVFQPLLQILKEDKECLAKSSALFGIYDLYKLGKLDSEILYHVLKKAMNDQHSSIKEDATRFLNEIQKENNKKALKYKYDLGFQ